MHDHALVFISRGYRRAWSMVQRPNIPMPDTKTYAGVLSAGQRYVVGTLGRDHVGMRHSLTIAVSRPGERYLSRLFRIRDDLRPRGFTSR